MDSLLTRAVAVTLVLAGVGSLAIAYRARRYWETPAGPTFVAMVVVNGTTAVVLGGLGILGVSDGAASAAMVAGFFFLAVPWGFFSMSYTGWRRLVTPLRVGALTAFATATSLVVILGEQLPQSPGSLATGVYFAMTMAGLSVSIGFGAIGVAIIVRTTYRSELVGPRRGALLSCCGVAPFLSLLLGQLTLNVFVPVAGYGILAVGFALGTVATFLTVERYDTFESTPAAGALGRSTVVSELDEAMVVVDERDRVVDLNDAAASTFEVDLASVAGDPVETVLGTTLSRLRSAETIDLHTATGHRQFDVSTSTVSDEHDRPMGWAILFRDVTNRRTRQQRLQVLNRVLRHNLRNDMNVVEGYAGIVEEEVEAELPSDYLDRIAAKASSLADLGEEAREVERLMSEPRMTDDREPLSTFVGRVVDRVREAYPDAEVRVDLAVDPDLRLNGVVVEQVLWQLAENAAEHSDRHSPTVEITARETGQRECPLAVTVVDDGPGIPDHEWAVVVEGDETDLEHGSGLGLWLVKWGLTRLGGRITLDDRSPGTAITVYLPERVGGAADDAIADPATSADRATAESSGAGDP